MEQITVESGMTPIQKNIRYIRECMNLSQSEMAGKLEVNLSAYKQWENGKNQPKLGDLSRFRCILNFTLDELCIGSLEADFDKIQILQKSVKSVKNK